MRDLVLLGHLFGAFLLVAGMTVAGIAFEAARRRQRPHEVALLLALTRVGVLLVAVGTLLALGFGLLLVDLSGFDYDAGWVEAAVGLLLMALLLGAIGGQRPKKARKMAVAEGDGARLSPQLQALLDDQLARSLNYLSLLLIVANLVLVVVKPGS